ncbi:MAG: hypothetical protein H6636_04095 [Anaerolineales bacterium]|nr:hypothetical protein [Anaerolineales bacterium]
MEQPTETQEPQPQSETPAPQPWVTPSFERVPLNEALFQQGPSLDGDGMS